MKKEITQPDYLSIPDVKDPFSWAVYTRLNAVWLRHIGPQMNMDMQPLMIGAALCSVIGDDYGAIGAWNVIINHPKNAKVSKEMLLERMDWESDTEELPVEIRTAALNTAEKIKSLDLADEQQYYQARDEWLFFQKFVQEYINEHPELQAALDYSREQNRRWSPYWQAFIGQEWE